jgi:hypothetical protein
LAAITAVRTGTRYGVEYENALRNAFEPYGHTLHVITEGEGSAWDKLKLFDPNLPGRHLNDGWVYFTDLDMVYLKDPTPLLDALRSSGGDINGICDWQKGNLNSSLLGVKYGSEGHHVVWDAWVRGELRPTLSPAEDGFGDQTFIWYAAKRYVGFLPGDLVDSYKVRVGMYPRLYGEPRPVSPTALVFHGVPKPPKVIENRMDMYGLIRAHWDPRPDGWRTR